MYRVGTLSRKIRSSVRHKLLALALLPVAIVLPIALAGLTAWGASFTYEQLYIKVNTDLAVAHDLFMRIQQDHRNHLARLGESYAFRDAIARGDIDAVNAQVDRLKDSAGFNFLRVVAVGDSEGARWRDGGVGIEILGPDALRAIDERLVDAVRLPLVQTRRARPTERRVEDRAMVIRARHPVSDSDGQVRFVLDGGVLLNNNFTFVDAIRDLVYGPGSLPAGSIGTVTVFLDEVRISTNVPRVAGTRALGTRVSDEVSRAVLDNGEKWINRAFVVNDWYISAYEPIIDIDGKRVGILYAGYLEAPFRAALWQTLGLVLLLLFGLLALYAVLAIRGAKSIFRPVERMSRVIRATRLGEAQRVGAVDSQDELAELAREFDAMLDRLEGHAADMQKWAEQLEDKVTERTAELQRRNDELQRTITVLRDTRRQLVTAEKLAALGELTAGVAHEINNPTQVMLGNLDVLMAELGARLDPVRGEVNLVIEQIYRIQAIIEKLLKYARPGEYAGYLAEVDVNQVVNDTVALVSHMRKHKTFEITLDLQATLPVTINTQELQQVLVNLISNAVHALPERGGRVRLSTQDWETRGACIIVADNGSGLSQDQCSRIFNPFYSTKPEGQGTGLGLSVSYGLIRRYGGNLTVSSTPGAGSEFRVWLLTEPTLIEDAETIAEQLQVAEADEHAAGAQQLRSVGRG
ncbi:MAG: cache domain-containing protein [Gammaproteobacteria bacterium]|nr:cache domain-containing protein [Gammaproteobacteria bacterium]